MSSTSKPLSYLPHVDGLRAVAVLIILLFHLDVSFLKGGFIGVDVFFVISGFLITQLISRDMKAGKFSFMNFYARRIKRIFPALFVMLLVTSIAAVFFLGPREYVEFFRALRSASGQIANVFFSKGTDYFAVGNDHNPLLHTWSLGVEEQFYVVWPILLLLTYRYLGARWAGTVLAMLMLVSLALSEYLVRTDTMQAFYQLHARAWELALGGLLGLRAFPVVKNRWVSESLGFAGLALVISSAFLLSNENFPGVKALLPCLGAALVLYSAQGPAGPRAVHNLLAIKPIVFVGLISYSLYLWHWPLIGFYKSYFTTELSAVVQLSIGVAACVFAYLSYRFIEQPLRHSRMSDRKVVIIAVCVIAAFIVGSNLVKRQNDAGWRVTYHVDKAVLEANNYYKKCAMDGSYHNIESCIIGPNKNAYEVILSGDSHAGHYIPTVLEWAKSRNLTVRIFLRGACKSFLLPGKTVIRHGKLDTDCMEIQNEFHALLEKNSHIQYVFLSLRRADADADVTSALEYIAGTHRKVVFLGSVPEFSSHPHDCQMKNNLLISKVFAREQRACLDIDHAYSDPLLEKSHRTMLPLLVRLNIPYFNPVTYMSSLYDKDGHFLYMDHNHMNQYGGLHLAPHLIEFVKAKNL